MTMITNSSSVPGDPLEIESLLYASGAISEPGSVEKGTTRTDTMFLERQRGITIQAAVTSFQWHRCKVNIVDTPNRRPAGMQAWHWPSFYNVVTGKTLALPNLIALQHIPLSPAGVIAKRPAPIALPNSCAA